MSDCKYLDILIHRYLKGYFFCRLCVEWNYVMKNAPLLFFFLVSFGVNVYPGEVAQITFDKPSGICLNGWWHRLTTSKKDRAIENCFKKQYTPYLAGLVSWENITDAVHPLEVDSIVKRPDALVELFGDDKATSLWENAYLRADENIETLNAEDSDLIAARKTWLDKNRDMVNKKTNFRALLKLVQKKVKAEALLLKEEEEAKKQYAEIKKLIWQPFLRKALPKPFFYNSAKNVDEQASSSSSSSASTSTAPSPSSSSPAPEEGDQSCDDQTAISLKELLGAKMVESKKIPSQAGIMHGRDCLEDILTGQTKSYSGDAGCVEYINDIISLIWRFYAHAANKDQAFEEGTFYIPDNEDAEKIFNFLHGYVDFVKGHDIARWVPGIAPNPFAYSRISSHYKESEPEQFGIDIRFNAEDQVRYVLPARKAHILFGKKFIKIENHGLNSDGILPHGYEFVIAQARKNVVARWLFAMQSDDSDEYRKERVPADELKKFSDLLKELSLSDEEKADYKLQAKEQGIKVMHAIAKVLREHYVENIDATNKLDAYLQYLINAYGEKYIQHRTGREVMLGGSMISGTATPEPASSSQLS